MNATYRIQLPSFRLLTIATLCLFLTVPAAIEMSAILPDLTDFIFIRGSHIALFLLYVLGIALCIRGIERELHRSRILFRVLRDRRAIISVT